MKSFMDLELSPLHNNIGASLLMVIYFKIAIELICWINFRFKGPSRHMYHGFLTSLVIFWPLFDTSEWSWRLHAIVPAVMASRLLFKGGIRKDPNDPDVQNLSLSSSPSDLLFGPLQIACVMVWLGLYKFMSVEAAIIAGAAFGDGIAPIIGARYGRHIFYMPFGNSKTMEGSVVGVFLGTVAGSYTYLYMMGIPLLPLRMILAYAGIASVVEATAPMNLDNLVIPVVLHFSIDRVQDLLPA
jgi:CDP-diglyceride synthetase